MVAPRGVCHGLVWWVLSPGARGRRNRAVVRGHSPRARGTYAPGQSKGKLACDRDKRQASTVHHAEVVTCWEAWRGASSHTEGDADGTPGPRPGTAVLGTQVSLGSHSLNSVAPIRKRAGKKAFLKTTRFQVFSS